MVNRSVLRKLSNRELENYLQEGNRFVPKAVQIAFEILLERGRIFTEQEKVDIQRLIQHKKDEEEAKKKEETEAWQDHVTDDPHAVKLYSRTAILVISIFFSTIPASILLSLNLIKLKKYPAAILILVYGFLFFILQKYILLSNFDFTGPSRFSPEIGIIAAGAIGLIFLWVTTVPKKLPYRPESYLLPVILCAVTAVLMYLYFEEWFSYYPFAQVIRLLR